LERPGDYLEVGYSRPFHFIIPACQVDKTFVTQGDYVNHGEGHYNQGNVQVSLSYSFGSSNTRVKQTEKTVENDDLVGGLRNGN